MAQRQRAGLITPRSQDRNLLPVYMFLGFSNLFRLFEVPQSGSNFLGFLDLY